MPAGTSPYAVAITPNDQYIYVTNLAYTTTDTPVVNYIGKVSVISLDASSNVSPSSGSSSSFGAVFSLQLLIIVVFAVVIVVLALIIAVKRKPWKKQSTNTERMLTSPLLF